MATVDMSKYYIDVLEYTRKKLRELLDRLDAELGINEGS